MKLESPVASEYQVVSTYKSSEYFNNNASLCCCGVLEDTWVDFHLFSNHQSSILFNNAVILPPIQNNLDKNIPKNTFWHPSFLILISLRFTQWSFIWYVGVSTNANTWTTISICHKISFIEIILLACFEWNSDPRFFVMISLFIWLNKDNVDDSIFACKIVAYVHMLGVSSGSDFLFTK